MNRRSRIAVVLAELERLIEDRISGKGVHLIDLQVRGEGNGRSLEVFIDSEAGITTEVCSEVSREVDRVIVSGGYLHGPYRLTVSSPGIGRPLRYLWQYRKHIGRRFDLIVRSGEGTRRVEGTLLSMNETGIELSEKDGRPETIPVSSIVEARVKAPW